MHSAMQSRPAGCPQGGGCGSAQPDKNASTDHMRAEQNLRQAPTLAELDTAAWTRTP
jgi:hypothetical protein